MIGIFDSGVGGLTVMRHLTRLLPHESIVYFGDTARLPYGDKSGETIRQYAMESAYFLLSQNIKRLIIACNSASAHAYPLLKQELPIPVFDVIRPGVKLALEKGRRIAILGTKATISSKIYEQEIKKIRPETEVISISCPLFVPLIEECGIAHPAIDLFVTEYLKPLKQIPVDTVILGCTHYPFLKEKIERELGSAVNVIDSGFALAQEVQKSIRESQSKDPLYHYFVSDDPEKFQRLAKQLLGSLPGLVQKAPCKMGEEKAYAY